MFKKLVAVTLFAVAVIAPAQAQLKYLPGRDYQVLQQNLDESQAPKIIEFFWYGCPHCYDFEKTLNQWLKNDKDANVVFEKVPAVTQYWQGGAQLYYTAHALNLPDIDKKIFDAYHRQDKRDIVHNKAAAIDFLVANGADKQEAEKAWQSLAVKQKVLRAKHLFDDSHLAGVPSFLVNGVYAVSMDHSYSKFLDTASFLSQRRDKDSAK